MGQELSCKRKDSCSAALHPVSLVETEGEPIWKEEELNICMSICTLQICIGV